MITNPEHIGKYGNRMYNIIFVNSDLSKIQAGQTPDPPDNSYSITFLSSRSRLQGSGDTCTAW